MKSHFRAGSVPYLAWMALFTIIPTILVIYFSFTTQDGAFTLDNFRQMLKGEYTIVFFRSFKLAFIATAICLILGFPFAYILSKIKTGSQPIMIMLIMLPMWMNLLLRTYAWMSLLENNGLINRFLGFFNISPLQMIYTEGAVVLGMVYNFLPFMILPIFTVLIKLDNSLIEAAQDLGSNSLHVFRRVIFPLSVPGIISGITMVFVPAVSTFIISKMLGGGTHALIGDLIEMQFIGNAQNMNLGSAISLVMMIVILICMGIMSRVDNGNDKAVMM